MKNQQETISRIMTMEGYFDALVEALEKRPEAFSCDEEIKSMFDELIHYYTGGQWLRDHDLDSQGSLPADLKRGVLSEDAVYDFLTELSLTGVEALPPVSGPFRRFLPFFL